MWVTTLASTLSLSTTLGTCQQGGHHRPRLLVMLRKVQHSGHSMLKHSAGQTPRSTGMRSRPAAALASPRPPATLQRSMQSLLRPRRAQLRVNRPRPVPLLCRTMWRRHALESLPLHLPSPGSCIAKHHQIERDMSSGAPAAGLMAPALAEARAHPKAQADLPGQVCICLSKHMLKSALEQYHCSSWHYMRLLCMGFPHLPLSARGDARSTNQRQHDKCCRRQVSQHLLAAC